jgi:hypothetical protein
VDAATGDATPWNPSADNVVKSVAANEPTVYVGGRFIHIGGQKRPYLAAMGSNVVPVLLSRFQATPQPGAILIEWETSTELGFAGFHLWRSREGGPEEQLTPALITSPADYRFFDVDVVPGVTYRYRLEALDRTGDRQWFGPVTARLEPGVSRGMLGQSVPNPFRGSEARIPFVLPQAGEVRLRVLDLAGRQVRLLVQERLEAGPREAVWDGRDDGGREVSGGVYLYEVESPGLRATRRLIRIR